MKPIIETIVITFLGGMLFTLLHVPLSWMLGPMTAVLLWNTFTRRNLVWPTWLRNGGLLLLGYSMGLSLTLESTKKISTQLPYMLIATLLTIMFSLIIAFLISRLTGVSVPSSVIGSIPGGLSQMIVLSEEIKGADAAVVAFMQTVRLLLVVFVIPFVAVHGLADGMIGGSVVGGDMVNDSSTSGLWDSLAVWAKAMAARPLFSCMLVAGVAAACWIAVKLHFPTSYFLGPFIAAAAFTVSGTEPPHLPSLFVLMAQWSLGIYMGTGIKLSSLSNWKRLLPYTIFGNIAVILFSVTLSYVFSLFMPMSLLTAFLGMSPGGMAEMAVTATLIGADVSVVVAYQIFRILFILFIVPYLLRWGFKYFKNKANALSSE